MHPVVRSFRTKIVEGRFIPIIASFGVIIMRVALYLRVEVPQIILADNNYLRDLYLNFFQDEPREFIELLSYCREQMVSEEKLEESVKRLLGTCGDNVTVERLLALIGNKHPVTPITETTDNIAIKAKEQLTWITQLMHQTNNNGQYKSANSRI
jgi:hypothetical protein